jgi:hypothetical protein
VRGWVLTWVLVVEVELEHKQVGEAAEQHD